MRTSERQTRWMQSAFGLALLCGLAVLTARGQAERLNPVEYNRTYRIAGVVVSEASGAPLGRARVTIIDASSPRNTQSMVTAEGGHFEFNHLKPGKYALEGARRGFITTAYNHHQQFSTAIVTGPSFETENLILRLVPVATISGKVLDEAGEPVRNAQVKLYRENHNLGFSQISPLGNATSDDRGYYDFWPVIPGTYYVAATASPWYAVHPPSEHSGFTAPGVDPSLDVTYPTTFYADTTDSDDATAISVKGGDHAQIEIHLWPVPSLHLFVHLPENGEYGFWQPTLQKRVFDSVEYLAMGETHSSDSEGTYELTGVPLGTYTVRLHSPQEGQPDEVTEIKATRDGQELDLSSADPLGSLNLNVKIPGQARIPEQLFVALQDSRLRFVDYQTVDRNGEAHFKGLAAGKYTLLAGSRDMPYSVLRTVAQDSESPGDSIELASGAALSLTAFLVGGSANVEGFATGSGKPASGVMVVLVPADPDSHVGLFRRDQSDLDGSFVLRNVIPGSYTVIAIEDGWSLDWSVPSVLARYTPRGQKITVALQEKGAVRLPEPVDVQAR